ncbi:MAG: hypothetical protein IJG80_00435 [Selenomonadaceae bacterium]|nr:hypothetical protein [Selenomonadaceae bacterium]
MKQIFFVRNARVWEEISKGVDKNSVAAVYNLDYFEKIPGDKLPDEISLDGLERFKSDDSGENIFHAVIAVETGAPKGDTQFGQSYFRRLSLAVARTLKRNGINFSFPAPFGVYAHLHGVFPNLQSDLRNRLTLALIQEVFQTFPQEFTGKKIDMWFSFWDEPDRALDLAEALDLPHVFTYCTSFALKDRVIAFPDYESRFRENLFPNDANSNARCREAAAKHWQDSHAFWRGSRVTSFSRTCLFELGKKFPQYLKIEDSSRGGQFVPMTEQAKYKYLIDTRGNSWSSRLQTLLKLGRVIFIADRPCREWYFDRLRPWEHYVPIKEDMSDLIEKICHMERCPELYEKIVGNMREFVEENLMPRRIVFDAKEMILRYAVVE